MKRTIFTMSAALCLAFSSVLLSCDGIAQKINGGGQADSYETKEFIISGTLSLEGAVPSVIASFFRSEKENEGGNARTEANKNARTAVPTIQVPSSYMVSAEATISGKKETREGVVDDTNKTFTIKLTEGTWTVKAEGYSSSSSKTTSTKVLEGQTTVTLSPNNVNNNISITLSPISSGTGSVNLTVSWENDTGIKLAKITFEDLPNIAPCISPPTNYTAGLFFSGIQSGSHTARIDFYDSNNVSGQDAQGKLLYSTHEVINVFQNLTTNTWQGNAPYFTETNGKTEFKVTKTLVDAFSNRKVFYVQGTNGTYNPSKTASDDNSGTYFDPFASVQKAVTRVKEINDGTSSYKIYVDGTTQEPASDFQANSQYSGGVVAIHPDKNLNLTIEGLNGGATTNQAEITRTKENFRILNIYYDSSSGVTSVNITLKNLTLKGGQNTATSNNSNGAGINLLKGNLTLSNVTVTNNIASNTAKGGGIYVASGATLTLNEKTSVSSNQAAESGGGIYVASGGTLIVNTATISENKSSKNGAGIYIESGSTVNLTEATISQNKGTDTSLGAGIYSASGLTITRGTISDNGKTISNASNSVQKGGGIYFDCSTTSTILTLDGVKITGNSASLGKSIYAGGIGTLIFRGAVKAMADGSSEDICLAVDTSNSRDKTRKAGIQITNNLSDSNRVACLSFVAKDSTSTQNVYEFLVGGYIITRSSYRDFTDKFTIANSSYSLATPESTSDSGSTVYSSKLKKN